MIVTTTNTLETHRVQDYLGIVTGEAIQGAHIGRDILASFRDVFGGRSAAYEGSLREAREEALREMIQAAKARGADAVIGVDIDYEVLGKTGGMLMVTAAGTAVKLTSRS
jgi:uncharacterized protein YbjQ (UPF0145 family)